MESGSDASPQQPPQRPSSGSRLTPSKATSSSKVVAGDYQLAGKLGRGGSGGVYKAIHRLKGHIVAIKVISVLNVPKDQISNVEAEIRLMRGLKHPNIVKYIDSKLEGSDLCIVLEYVEGGSLSKIMHDVGQGTLPESLVTIYISKMLRGLVYLHSEGVIHRDIKAANILVDRDGEVRLADFGVAIQTQSSTMGSGAVRDVVGTPYWMAPEVITGEPYDQSADIWSLGITAYEMATGRPPYYSLHAMRALFLIPTNEPPRLEEGHWSEHFRSFMASCLQKEASARPSATALCDHPFIAGALDSSALCELARGSVARQQRPAPPPKRGAALADAGPPTPPSPEPGDRPVWDFGSTQGTTAGDLTSQLVEFAAQSAGHAEDGVPSNLPDGSGQPADGETAKAPASRDTTETAATSGSADSRVAPATSDDLARPSPRPQPDGHDSALAEAVRDALEEAALSVDASRADELDRLLQQSFCAMERASVGSARRFAAALLLRLSEPGEADDPAPARADATRRAAIRRCAPAGAARCRLALIHCSKLRLPHSGRGHAHGRGDATKLGMADFLEHRWRSKLLNT